MENEEKNEEMFDGDLVYKGKGSLFGIPYQKKKEYLTGSCNRTQIDAIENMFYVCFGVLGLLDRKQFIIEEGEYIADENNIVLSKLGVFCLGHLLLGYDVVWRNVSKTSDNYLYVIPSTGPICFRKKFVTRVLKDVKGKVDTFILLAVARYEDEKWLFQLEHELKPPKLRIEF